MAVTAALVALVLAGCGPVLDADFGGGSGVIHIDKPVASSIDEPGEVLVQPDGKIVFVYSRAVVGQQLYLVRLNSDGGLDETFGDGGTVTVGYGGASVAGLLRQPDGRYLVSGTEAGITRFHADGTVDTSFDLGELAPRHGTPEAVGAVGRMALLADGRIVSGVEDGNIGVMLARWLPDGTLDRSFGVDGFSEHHVQDPSQPLTTQERITDLAVQADGAIVVVGAASRWWEEPDGPRRHAVARFLADGTVDTSFGAGGGIVDDLGGAAAGVAVQPDGRIVVTGTTLPRYADGESRMFLVRYGAGGARDGGFGDGGVVRAVSDGTARDVEVLPNGKVLVAGGPWLGPNGPDVREGVILVRVAADGTFDESFGEHGISTTDVFDGQEGGYHAAVQSNGRLVVTAELPDPDVVDGNATVGVYRFRLG